jgi:putative modified peptide
VAEDKIPPAGLHPQLVKKLLDSLESDEGRALFQESPEKALRELGYTDPWACLQMQAGAKLASAEQIRGQRLKLEDSLVGIHSLLCPLELQEGSSAE